MSNRCAVCDVPIDDEQYYCGFGSCATQARQRRVDASISNYQQESLTALKEIISLLKEIRDKY